MWHEVKGTSSLSKIIKYVCMQEAPIVIDSKFLLAEDLIDTTASDELMNLVNDEAAMILAQAKVAAEHCLSEANKQIVPIKQQAYDEGHQQGYQEGFTQGHQAGTVEMEQVINQTIARSQQMLAAAEQAAKEMILGAEAQIIDIALAVARKILAYEIAENPMVVLPLVKATLQKVSDQEDVVIRVSIDDFDAVLLAKTDLQMMIGREHALKIIVDRTVHSGSCVIDTSYGTVDARVDAQFEIIKKTLQDVIK
ncbi:MAG: flagellar assembly protein FliH [Sporomusaceae bacterium]|nr:flagellar assembly protein FliH [Sporomusaceae bacterium]